MQLLGAINLGGYCDNNPRSCGSSLNDQANDTYENLDEKEGCNSKAKEADKN